MNPSPLGKLVSIESKQTHYLFTATRNELVVYKLDFGAPEISEPTQILPLVVNDQNGVVLNHALYEYQSLDARLLEGWAIEVRINAVKLNREQNLSMKFALEANEQGLLSIGRGILE